MEQGNKEIILDVRDLHLYYPVFKGRIISIQSGWIQAVRGVSFQLCRNEILGIVGESGCGKSSIVKALLMLRRPTMGSVKIHGTDMASLSELELREHKRNIQVVFQNPLSSLDPSMTVGRIISEPLIEYGIGTKAQRQARVRYLLHLVGLPADSLEKYPSGFSGGQQQRIAIARALALGPDVLIADEPVTALDVSIQARILNLFKELARNFNLSIIFISHDISVIRYLCDRVLVMKEGEIVENKRKDVLFDEPEHPYTKELLSVARENSWC